MKRIALLLLISAAGLAGKAQKTDSVPRKPSHSFPILIVPLFAEIQSYLPSGGNRFNMTWRLSAGTQFILNVHKHISIMAGGRLWQSYDRYDRAYSIESRSLGQSGFHSALGIVYTRKLAGGRLYVGPAWNRISYFLGSVVPGPKNQAFQDVSDAVHEKVSGIRGTYYSTLYLVGQWERNYSENKKLFLEANVMLPTDLGAPFNTWQPKGTLVHALRVKAKYDTKHWSGLVDLQLPTLLTGKKASYDRIVPGESTGKIEGSYNIPMKPMGKLRFLFGYERDWHALNFPLLLRGTGLTGTWGAFYAGIRVDLLGMVMSK